MRTQTSTSAAAAALGCLLAVAHVHASPILPKATVGHGRKGAMDQLLLRPPSPRRLLDEHFSVRHNSQNGAWKAGKTPFSDMSVDEFGCLFGGTPKPTEVAPTLATEWPLQAEWERITAANTTFPDWFDPRRRWHWCPTLSQIRDQGMCGSCWAHGVTEALSDRYCTMANITTSMSAHDVSFCCKGCGAGCGGGDPETAPAL